jgi:phospholipid transport system transporter-binding protein
MRTYRRPYHAQDLSIAETEPDYYRIKGELSFATINQATVKLVDCTRSRQTVNLDLQGVTASDSAALALMIEWLKTSKQHHCTLRFLHLPAQLLALATLSGIEHYLTLAQPSEAVPILKTTTDTPWTN